MKSQLRAVGLGLAVLTIPGDLYGLSTEEIQQQIAPSIAEVRANVGPLRQQDKLKIQQVTKFGSGFVINSSSVMTLCQVVKEGDQIVVTLKGTGERLFRQRLCEEGIAVLEAKSSIPLPAALRVDSSSLNQGDAVYIVGWNTGRPLLLRAVVEQVIVRSTNLSGGIILLRSESGTPDRRTWDDLVEMSNFAGGAVVDQQGAVRAVVTASSGDKIEHPLGGRSEIPKHVYHATPIPSALVNEFRKSR